MVLKGIDIIKFDKLNPDIVVHIKQVHQEIQLGIENHDLVDPETRYTVAPQARIVCTTGRAASPSPCNVGNPPTTSVMVGSMFERTNAFVNIG